MIMPNKDSIYKLGNKAETAVFCFREELYVFARVPVIGFYGTGPRCGAFEKG